MDDLHARAEFNVTHRIKDLTISDSNVFLMEKEINSLLLECLVRIKLVQR